MMLAMEVEAFSLEGRYGMGSWLRFLWSFESLISLFFLTLRPAGLGRLDWLLAMLKRILLFDFFSYFVTSIGY